MTDQDVRDFLERMVAEEPTQFIDAESLTRRARRRAARTAIVGAIGVAVAIAVLFAGVAQIRTAPAPIPADGTPNPSVRPLTERFDSPIHGISIDPPSGWQTRAATEAWTGESLDFDSPAADVIFDPAMEDRLYLAIASQPYGGLSEDAWRNRATNWLCTGEGAAFGSWTVDGADTFVITCGSTASAALIFTDTRGYLIRLVAPSDEPSLAETYDWDWHKEVLETVDLRPEDAFDALNPSESQ